MHVVKLSVTKFVPLYDVNRRKANVYPCYVKRLQNRKKVLWRLRKSGRASAAEYQHACDAYTKAVKRYHRQREQKLLRMKPKNFYRFLNNKLKSKKSLPIMRCNNGDTCVSDIDKASGFLAEFKQVFTNDNNVLPPFNRVNTNCSDNVDFSPNVVCKYLHDTNKGSAAGPDGIPGMFWQKFAAVLSVPLSIIFTCSYNAGKLPTLWKKSFVVPIHKKGDLSSFANYRPVSLTCIPCKVMESIIRNVMMSYLNENLLISTNQHGFLSKHSTGLQLLECMQDWTDAIECNKCVDVCYIDFSRAFDSVSIPKLVFKLSCYGFTGRLLTWMSDFLKNRVLCVRVNNVLSDITVQTSGIAQGTCLGPICFVLYINDLPSQLRCDCKLFADDVKLYCQYKPGMSTDYFQNDLNVLAAWADAWQLQISVPKTFMLYLGSQNPRRVYDINGSAIVSKEVIKDLGVHVSSTLSWHSHCIETAKKANSVANAIIHSFSCNDVSIYMKAFDTYVRPIVEYNCFVWWPKLCMDIDLIENVQKCFTRRVFRKCGLEYVSYADRLLLLDRESLEIRRLLLCLTTFYNIYYTHVSCNVLQNFRPTSLTLRGNSCKLFIPYCHSSVKKNSFVYRCLYIWNILPNNVVTSNVSTAFTNRLRNVDLSNFLR